MTKWEMRHVKQKAVTILMMPPLHKNKSEKAGQ
jgi:hypothetical protein